MRRGERKLFKDRESVQKVKERFKSEICHYNCGIIGHMTVKCNKNQRHGDREK